MIYIPEDNIQIKKWKKGPARCFFTGRMRPYLLDEEEYALIKRCDGKTQIEKSAATDRLEVMGIIRRCLKETDCSGKNPITEYPNYYIMNLDWTITDRCNCNCLHCFHAADNEIRRNEFSLEDAYKLLDEAKSCGIMNIRLTGGEPMLHPHISKIVEGIHNRGMKLSVFLTNGTLLTREFLALIKEYNPDAWITISFDGIGYHDWLRQRKGCEEEAVRAVGLCREAGLKVYINSNVNRRNQHVMFDSFQMLSDLGIDKLRIIRTSEAPRWVLNKQDYMLSLEEYYDFSMSFAKQYKDSGASIPVIIWQSLFLDGSRKVFSCLPVKSGKGCPNDNYLCSAMMVKLSVQADGEMVPCAPLGGLYAHQGIHLGNIHEKSLQELLTEGPLIDVITSTVSDKLKRNKTCAECPHVKNCQGGCPALALANFGSMYEPDTSKCVYFNQNYYEKHCEAMTGWKNLQPYAEPF